MSSRGVRFVEVQYFRQFWLWLVLIAMVALTAGLFAWGVYVQLVLGRPWGNNPMSDRGLVIFALAILAFDAALVALFARAHLRTEVRDDGLYVRFFPFHLSFHRLPLAEVSAVEVVTYRALADYGGWGIRYSLGLRGRTPGQAYNVSGSRGVKLSYRKGDHLLLGSQQPDQLAAAIDAMRGEGGGR